MAEVTADRNRGQAQPQPLLAPNWFLGLVPRELWDRYKTFFIYEQDFIPLGANATTTGTIQIQDDSHFLAVAGVALVVDVTNTTVLNSESNANASGIQVQVFDVASGAPLSQTPVPLDNMYGTAQRPAVWPLPKLFRASSSIATQAQNLLGTARNVRLSYWGIRIYPSLAAAGRY
jgi:hypothetical protein